MVEVPQNGTDPPARRRPQSQSASAAGDGGNNAAQAFSQPRRRSRSGLLQEALDLSNKAEVDAILERRQNEGIPPLQDADSAAIGLTAADSEVRITPSPGYAGGRLPMTADERDDAHADVFGRPSPDAARRERRLAALEREVGRLPKSERRALTRAMRKNPLLFVNCPHARMLLDQDAAADDDDDGEGGGGHFDAPAAARRLARYWDRRRALLGDAVCYAPGTLAEPVLVDYRRYYERTLAALRDPDADEMAREDAARMIDIIHRRKVEALDAVLEEMEIDRETGAGSFDGSNREDHDDGDGAVAVDNPLGESAARTMAMESSDELKLQFLQAENMIEAKAARRLVRYWETGLSLFGRTLQERKSVVLDDLRDCSVLFELGLLRLVPSEDDYGRSVLIWREIISEEGQDEECSNTLSEEKLSQLGINEVHFAKVTWYVFHAILERSTSKHGFAVILDFRNITGSRLAKFRAYRQAARRVNDCVPVKCRAVHCLLGNEQSWWLRKLWGSVYLVSAAIKRRLVVHACDMEDNLEELSRTFGIRRDILPDDLGGAVDEEYFVRWVEDRMAAGV